MMKRSAYFFCLMLVLVFLSGCTGLKQYRTQYAGGAVTNGPDATRAIEETPEYLLGFVEFDDHGWLWDAKQMRAVMARLEEEDKKQGLLIVVFAHGWKHNAASDDENVASLRSMLKDLQAVEQSGNRDQKRVPRKVVGVYLGWRGLSQKLWGIKELSFWERKRTAHAVGQGAVGELLAELDTLRKKSRITHVEAEKNQTRQPTMLVVVGHSFGGAVVYSAVAPFLEERLINTIDDAGQARPARGFGDLVVLINPAFEAARFEILKRTSDERIYTTNQPATLAVFTSKADWATGLAFPAGRRVSTIFEKHRRDQPQYQANITAVGHYDPYITHDLRVRKKSVTAKKPGKSPKILSKDYTGQQTVGESATKVEELRSQVHRTKAKPKREQTVEDRTYHFSGTDLDPREKVHKENDPVYVVAVDKKIIPNHSDFETQAFLTFLREFILAFTGNP